MNIVHTEKYRTYTIKIAVDEHPCNPATEWDMLATHVLMYSGGWRRAEVSTVCTETNSGVIDAVIRQRSEAVEKFIARIRREGGVAVEWPYPGNIEGFSYVRGATVAKEYGNNSPETVANVEHGVTVEQEAINAFCEGNVYGWEVEKGGFHDSCWGYYGDYDDPYMLQCARESIDHRISQRKEAREFERTCFAL